MEASYIVYVRRGDPASEACIQLCAPNVFYIQDVDELKMSLMQQGRNLPGYLKGIPTVCTNESPPKVWVGSNAMALIQSVNGAMEQQTKRARRGGGPGRGGAPPRHVPTHRAPRAADSGGGGGATIPSSGGRAPPHRVAGGGGNMPSGPAPGGDEPTQMHEPDIPIAPPSGPAAVGCTVNDELFNLRFNRKDQAPSDSSASLNDLMARYNQGR